MAVFGVAFLVAVVLLGIYGLRVRAARLKQAENAIAELEDALRQTGAAVGRVESEIAAVTDAVKGALTSPEPAKPAPKAEPSISPRDVLLNDHLRQLFWYYLPATVADACSSLRSPLSDWVALKDVLFRHASERHHEEVLSTHVLDWYREEWKAVSNVVPPSRLVGKVPKGVRYLTLHPGEAPYYHPKWTALTCAAPSR